MSESGGREPGLALREIRAAEAARMLGLLDVGALVEQAAQWVRDGITHPSARALAQDAAPSAPGRVGRPVLLATLATECGIHLAGLDEARAVHAQSVIGMMSTGGDFPQAVFAFSNNYTDHVTDWFRNLIKRRRSPRQGS